MNDDRVIVAVFCDDIRYERGNKHSLMGCYSDQLILEQVPATIPKLCVEVTTLTPLEHPFSKLTLRAILNDEIIGVADITGENLAEMQKGVRERSGADTTRLGIRAHMVFSPLAIIQPSTLRVEAETEEGIIKGSRLTIRAINPNESLG